MKLYLDQGRRLILPEPRIGLAAASKVILMVTLVVELLLLQQPLIQQ